MKSNALQNLDLDKITELAFSNTSEGEVLVELFVTPEQANQGNGHTCPSLIVAGMDLRVDNENNVEIHDLIQDGILHHAYVEYINFVPHDDGSYEYDGINLFIYEKDNISANNDDAKFAYSFDSLRDALSYLKQNFTTNIQAEKATPLNEVTKPKVIRDPLAAILGRQK